MHPPHLPPVLCLASTSPRRRELLMQIGVPFCLASANVDESVPSREAPAAYVQRLAREKALAVVRGGQSLPVLAADTTVVLDDEVLGKPRDRQDGIAMLRRLSGREHQVLTAIALVDSRGSPADARPLISRLSSSRVRFRPITARECSEYWDSGEPRDKAGGYAIQGLAAVFVESLQGSYSGVMGLPLFETAELLREAAIPYWCRSSP